MSISELPAGTTSLTQQVAAEIRATLARFSMKQADLAVVLGVTQAHASRKLRCVTPFALDEIERVAEWFSTSPGYLLGYAEGPRPTMPEHGPEWYTARDSNPEPVD